MTSYELSSPGSAPGNPWLETFGQWADDPDFDELMDEIARVRAMEDGEGLRLLPDTDQPPQT